jgi:parvulin-like peptidyl-prolyl isomerase
VQPPAEGPPASAGLKLAGPKLPTEVGGPDGRPGPPASAGIFHDGRRSIVAILAIAGLLSPAGMVAQDLAVAAIDGEPLTQSDILRHLLRDNWAEVTGELTLEVVLDIELAKAGITVAENEIDEEQDAILRRIAPQKTPEQVKATGAFSKTEMRRHARVSRGWRKLFVAAGRLPAKDPAFNTNEILKQLFIRQTLDQYEIRVRGKDLEPVPRLVAWIKAKDGNDARAITEDDALALLTVMVTPEKIDEALEDLVDSRIVDRELARSGKTVSESEVEAWARSMQEMYKPPFDWRMICQFKGTTPDRENERWRRIQAWKRITGREADPAELEAFVAKNIDHFSGQIRNPEVRHILIMTVDAVTGDLSPEEQAQAKQLIDMLAEKIREGVDFGWLAERYSEDPKSARSGGLVDIPFSGTGLDPAFRDAAWKLGPGEVSPPVRSRFGWHLIKRDFPSRERETERRFEKPAQRAWIVDEFETLQMKEWLATVRSRADVWIRPR